MVRFDQVWWRLKLCTPIREPRFQDDLSRFHLRSRKEISSPILDDYSRGKLSQIDIYGGLLAQSLSIPSQYLLMCLYSTCFVSANGTMSRCKPRQSRGLLQHFRKLSISLRWPKRNVISCYPRRCPAIARASQRSGDVFFSRNRKLKMLRITKIAG